MFVPKKYQHWIRTKGTFENKKIKNYVLKLGVSNNSQIHQAKFIYFEYYVI